MKRLSILVAAILSLLQVCAQDKYALLFSRPVITKDSERDDFNKQVSRNNIRVINNGLSIQRFSPSNLITDTSGSIRQNILRAMANVTTKIRKGDFVFLYFDVPVIVNDATQETGFGYSENDFISFMEMNELLRKIVTKNNDPSLFFFLVDADISQQAKIGDELYSHYFFASLPGQTGRLNENTSVFALAVEKSLKSISDLNATNHGFFGSVKSNMLLFTTKQTPLFLSPDINGSFFNNQSVKFPRYYEVIEKKNDTTVVINAGIRMNIANGSQVNIFPPYADTAREKPLVTGTVINTFSATAVIKLSRPVKEITTRYWAFITGYDLSKITPVIRFNKRPNGVDDKSKEIFQQVLNECKKAQNNGFIKLTEQGGDVGIGGIISLPENKYEITLLNPQTSQVLTTMVINGVEELHKLTVFCKKLAQYEYISSLTNYIPELSVDFQMTDKQGNPLTAKENGYDILYEGDEVIIKIRNTNLHRLYYSLVDLTQDKNFTVISGRDMADHFIQPDSELKLPVTISAPFGKERIKLFTSNIPFDLGDFLNTTTRSVKSNVSFADINIQDYDFESRSSLYARNAKQNNELLFITVKDLPEVKGKTIAIRNPSSERIYFNVYRQKEDGGYTMIFPGTGLKDKDCYVEFGVTRDFLFDEPLNAFDQLITVYADRPFNLEDLVTTEKKLNSLFADIAKNGRIPGTALNKIGLAQALFQPGTTTTMRDGESIFIKLITPKVSNERGITIPAPSQQYDINGFAMSVDNKPVKSLKINNEPVNYDANLRFFEHTVNLSDGVNKVIIEATDEKGFTAVRTLSIELKNNNTVVAQGKGKNYFLGIGIDNYKTWPVLNNAKNDVVKFAELLKVKYGFDSSFLLLDEQATRKNIINKIREFLKKTGPNDNVVIYLSGHGNEDQLADGDYYFIPQEAEADDVTGAVKSTDIVDNFKKIRAKRCLLIVDACYSGMITNSVNPSGQPLTSGTDLESAENAPCKWIVTSGRATKVSDGEKGKNSPFATVLINYLREHEDDASLKMPRLIDFLKEKVKELSKQQEPLGMPIEGRGEWIFKVPGK
jgi:Caspase domain